MTSFFTYVVHLPNFDVGFTILVSFLSLWGGAAIIERTMRERHARTHGRPLRDIIAEENLQDLHAARYRPLPMSGSTREGTTIREGR